MEGENAEDVLSSFREKWQKELEEIMKKDKNKDEEKQKERAVTKKPKEIKNLENESELEKEKLAEKWFLRGVENERSGRLYEAIQFYKKAVQLVPDIEFKIYESFKTNKNSIQNVENKGVKRKEEPVGKNSPPETETETKDELKFRFLNLQSYLAKCGTVCSPKKDQKSTHISALPVEIILYILRWVVSWDLDVRSLEMFSMVCRGFYLCSRDPEIWRMACMKVWGLNCGGLTNYSGWRQMFLQRPRLNYNGCYISKTTYVRHGENSFQDRFYRPWHVVEYYRYLRFFPEGQVLMLTTPDEPVSALAALKTREVRNPSVLTGHYRLLENNVLIVLQRQEIPANRIRSRRNNPGFDFSEQSFHIELQITNWKQKINSQLSWKYYCIVSKRGPIETTTNFEVVNSQFPSFWFSRVKNYTAESEKPLL